jgi:hypothetical protein
MPWPDWLDKIESEINSPSTCPDCWYEVDGHILFPKFKGKGCRHAEEPKSQEPQSP